MGPSFLSSEAFNAVLQAVLASSGASESFVLFHDGGGTVRLGPGDVRRLEGDWGAGLDRWLPPEGDTLPLLHGGQTVGLLCTVPGEALSAGTDHTLSGLLAQVSVTADPWSADQLSGQSALVDRCGRLRAATPGWFALFGLSGEATGQPLGELRPGWRRLEQVLPDVLAGRAHGLPAWREEPAGQAARTLGGDLRPWPVMGGELAALFTVWALDPAPRAAPGDAAPAGLASGHAAFQAIFGHAPQAQWIVDARGTVLDGNAAAAALEPGGAAATLGEPIWSSGVWRGLDPVRRQVRAAALRAGRGEASELLLEMEAGAPWQLRARPLDRSHALFEAVPLDHDPKTVERQLALLDVLMAHSGEAVIVTDGRGRPLMFSGAVRQMMMPGAQEAAARDWARHFELRGTDGAPLSPAQFPAVRALRGEQVQDEEVLVVSDQGTRSLAMSAHLLPGDLGAVVLARDLGEKRRLLSYLSQVTRRDPLTELPNRQAFLDRIETALEQRRHDPETRYAVLLCELGGLGDPLATFGPVLGQRLWLDCAARFRDVFRSTDLVARFEQGQFAALLARPGNGLGLILDRLRESFSVPFTVGGETFVPELQVGLVPDLGTQLSPHDVLFRASQSLRVLPVYVLASE
ncbi:diguanylate cyclase [uncultured Deinococcus sp.]|uniref:diguanylate cyclase domain-containing protein n=1 Tax=uncultured Deinococcus sp. TaxID=158789 RepID=UPI00258D3EF8|nr:diguanylate cyclase [uncultured Deinococcus sp.]